jgi:hypothetical protein
MRSVVGSAAETDDFDTPPPRRRSVKAPTSRGKPKITRPKRPVPESLLSRWIGSLRNSMRWGMFWGAVLLAFFFVVAVAGLFVDKTHAIDRSRHLLQTSTNEPMKKEGQESLEALILHQSLKEDVDQTNKF